MRLIGFAPERPDRLHDITIVFHSPYAAGGLEGCSPPSICFSARRGRQSRPRRAERTVCGEGCTFPTPLCVSPKILFWKRGGTRGGRSPALKPYSVSFFF